MERRFYVAAVISVLILSCCYVAYIRSQRVVADVATGDADRGAGNLAPPSRYQGDPTHLGRIKDCIARLSKESLDDSERLLPSPEEFNYPDFHALALNAQVLLHRTLSNRRVVKILFEYRPLKPGDSTTRAVRLFHAQLERHESIARAIFRAWADPTAPKNERSIRASQLSICAAIILVAEYCPPGELADCLDEVDGLHERLKDFAKGNPKLTPDVVEFIGLHTTLDNVFTASVIARSVKRHSDPGSAAATNLARLLGFVAAAKLTLVPYTSAMTEFDFPHDHEGVPVDQSKGSEEYDVYLVDRNRPDEAQAELIKKMRESLRLK